MNMLYKGIFAILLVSVCAAFSVAQNVPDNRTGYAQILDGYQQKLEAQTNKPANSAQDQAIAELESLMLSLEQEQTLLDYYDQTLLKPFKSLIELAEATDDRELTVEEETKVDQLMSVIDNAVIFLTRDLGEEDLEAVNQRLTATGEKPVTLETLKYESSRIYLVHALWHYSKIQESAQGQANGFTLDQLEILWDIFIVNTDEEDAEQ